MICTVPAPRLASPDVLRIIGEVEPGLCLYGLEHEWQVLRWRPETERVAEGNRMVARARKNGGATWDVWRRAALMQEGWSCLYVADEADIVNTSWLRDHLQSLLNRSSKQIESDMQYLLEEAEGVHRDRAKVKLVRSFGEQEGRSLYRIMLRHKRSFTSRVARALGR